MCIRRIFKKRRENVSRVCRFPAIVISYLFSHFYQYFFNVIIPFKTHDGKGLFRCILHIRSPFLFVLLF